MRGGQALANDLPNMQGSQGDKDPRCHNPKATLLHPTFRACYHGRHQIPLRHALLPRSKSRRRQQREEQDRGSNYPGAEQHTPTHVKLKTISTCKPDPEWTKLNSFSWTAHFFSR